MASLIVLGPNLPDQRNGSFHVHAEGCANINRNPDYKSREFDSDKASPMEFASEKEVAEYVYADMLDENDIDTLISDVYFHACVRFEKEAPMPATRTITFELFNEELFLTIEIESVDVENDLTLLRSVPNVRNIQLH